MVSLLFGAVLMMSGCLSRSEVLHSTSPDGSVDAILLETDCGATCSFEREIRLAQKGARAGDEVAWIDGPLRNKQAWGVNLRWTDANSLSVEYLRADSSQLLKPKIDIAGHKIEISLRDGVEDPLAPAGGMQYNLH